MKAEDVAAFLGAHGIGVPGVDLFVAQVPSTPENVVCVIPNGGPPPTLALAQADPVYQIRIRASQFANAESKAKETAAAFWDAEYQPKQNYTIGDTHVYYAKFLQEPTTAFAGFDANGRAEYAFNIQLHIRRGE